MNIYEDIINELIAYGAQTIILYGSRARGDFNTQSDIDIIAFRDEGESFRIARWDEQLKCYLDIFVETFSKFNESHLKIANGLVLLDKDGFGQKLIQRINLAVLCPNILPRNELNTRSVWYNKMIERAKIQDIEGLYRHQWALNTLIEDYFVFRGKHYLGPKKGFQYLKNYNPKAYELYQAALKSPQDISKLKQLVELIIHSSEVNLYYGLNELASKINDTLGFHENVPQIDDSTCGIFAYEFMQAWNQKFKEKVHIVFAMLKDKSECAHILIRLPTRELFDAHIGVHHDAPYLEKFKIIDMEIYKHELLEKWSHGFDRNDCCLCRNFDKSQMKRLINDFLQKGIDKATA